MRQDVEQKRRIADALRRELQRKQHDSQRSEASSVAAQLSAYDHYIRQTVEHLSQMEQLDASRNGAVY